MNNLSRREYLTLVGSAALAAVIGAPSRGAAAATKAMRGAFMILNTPFTATGAVDWDDLAGEAAFVDRAGCQGVVWPQGSSGVATLTKDERVKGMEVLARAMQGKRGALVLGVQGKDTSEMLEFARRAEALGTDAMIAMPPTAATTLDDYRAYFRALAPVTSRPVIVQTSGGARNLIPSTDLIIDLAREFPHMAYVKEESEPLNDRLRAEVAARTVMKGIFGANLGVTWLYQLRLGVDGVITGNAMYADLMAKIWSLHEEGKAEALRDAFSKLLLMRNLEEQIPGASLYIMKKRGVFKTTVRRTSAPASGTAPKLSKFEPTEVEKAEIEYRYAALQPYLTL